MYRPTRLLLLDVLADAAVLRCADGALVVRIAEARLRTTGDRYLTYSTVLLSADFPPLPPT